MMKNIIFDLGNTIVKYNPIDIIKSFGIENEEDIRIIEEKVFSRPLWDELEIGKITQEEFEEIIISSLPEKYKAIGSEICENWHRKLPVIEGTYKLIKKLKKDGYKLYLLSNVSKKYGDDKDEFEFLKDFDGFVFSGAVKMMKPDRKIYEYTLDTFNLKAEECIFIDDREENIKGAEKCGIKGFLFNFNPEDAEKFIYNN